MKHCRTKKGELSLHYEGRDYLLDCGGLDLPDELAESIRTHVNVSVDDDALAEASREIAPEPKPRRRGKPEADSSDRFSD